MYEAKSVFVKEKKTFVPDSDSAKKYQKCYNAYKKIYDAVRPIVADVDK